MKMHKRSQNSMEFVILASFMILVFAVFFIIIQQKIVSAAEEKNDLYADQIMGIAINEIKLAESVSDDYTRQFLLPTDLNGLPYTISVMKGVPGNSEIVINYSGKVRLYFLEQYVSESSTISSGMNSITKTEGIIYIQKGS